MSEYVIYTDSACDISPKTLAEWGVSALPLTFRFGDDSKEYAEGEMSIKDFYDKMRAGGVAKTAAVNTQAFADAFEAILKEGKDILYIGFSSGLSTTYNSARLAAEQLKGTYPDRRVITIDSLAASAGLGLILHLAVEKKRGGAVIQELAAYVESIKLKLCHWFTVDDLVYLKRGGRVSGVTAFVGNMLGIKPVLHVDNDGHLINIAKVRGRKTAVAALADRYTELADTPESNTVFISHADCLNDAEALAEMIKSRHGVETQIITSVGTVIGAHAGPGTLALFYIGKER